MKKVILLLILPVYFLASCSKSSTPAPDNKPVKTQPVTVFQINDVTTSAQRIVIGQPNMFYAKLSDTTGNITYDWKVFFDGEQIGNTVSGIDVKSVKLKTGTVGEYSLVLTITRGATDKSTLVKKVESTNADFQYGIWGDTEETIKNAELDNNNAVNVGLVGIPEVIPGNMGLTTIIYNKAGIYYTYYFKDGKLYAGAFTQSYAYVNQNTDLRGAYLQFFTEKDNMATYLNTTITEVKTWLIKDLTQIPHLDSTNDTRAYAIGWNYLKLDASAASSVGSGSLELHKSTSTSVLFEYILRSPNQ